jgi:hypothetical protein
MDIYLFFFGTKMYNIVFLVIFFYQQLDIASTISLAPFEAEGEGIMCKKKTIGEEYVIYI